MLAQMIRYNVAIPQAACLMLNIFKANNFAAVSLQEKGLVKVRSCLF